MKDLINEYRSTALLLEKRREELRRELLTARGEPAFLLEKRIDLLGQEIRDLLHAVDWMYRCCPEEE